jgi:hypothetical protein
MSAIPEHSHISTTEKQFYLQNPTIILLLLLLLPLGAQGIRETLFSLQFLNIRQPVGLLGRGISSSQGRYLTQANFNALSGNRTHDPSVRAGEDMNH